MNQFGYIFLIFIFYIIFHLFAIFSSQLLQIHPISLPKTSQARLSCMGAMNKQRYANPTTRSVLECYFGVTPGNLDISLLDSGKKSGLDYFEIKCTWPTPQHFYTFCNDFKELYLLIIVCQTSVTFIIVILSTNKNRFISKTSVSVCVLTKKSCIQIYTQCIEKGLLG